MRPKNIARTFTTKSKLHCFGQNLVLERYQLLRLSSRVSDVPLILSSGLWKLSIGNVTFSRVEECRSKY